MKITGHLILNSLKMTISSLRDNTPSIFFVQFLFPPPIFPSFIIFIFPIFANFFDDLIIFQV